MEETNREPGPRGFSTKPISLKIFSPHVLKLTLVDLPGLIRIAVSGQSEDSINQIQEMVLNYISQPNCLILAVTPANQDIANSDALNIAKVADPERERTIGVLTKLDLMDEGTDAKDILENKLIPLKRGYVGVLNRSQKDIDEGKDVKYILDKERKFFESKEYYKHIAHRMGTPYLQQLLQKTLRAHIKAYLPTVRNELAKKLTHYTKELEDFKNSTGGGVNGKQFYVIKLIQEFIDDVTTKLMGHTELVSLEKVSTGALIQFKLYTEIQNNLKLNLEARKEQLVMLTVNMLALRNAVTVPPLVIEAACQSLICQYKEPLEHSVNCIAVLLVEAMEQSAEQIKAYPTLRNEVLYKIRLCIEKEADRTRRRLTEHVESEMFFINFGHPDFEAAIAEVVPPAAGTTKFWDCNDAEEDIATADVGVVAAKLFRNERMEKSVTYMTDIIKRYLEIVQKAMGDVAIKYTVYFLVKKVHDFIRLDLIPTLVDSANINSLTEDCDDEFRRKEEITSTCACLQEALDAIQSF
ncbi:Dynamin-1, partial [Stegodyphus mimosarum]